MSCEGMSVQSELYTEGDIKPMGKPGNSNFVTEFHFRLPEDKECVQNGIEVDEDGDFIVVRATNRTIRIEHSMKTPIHLVGLQVWRGALLLADFVLCHGSKLFSGKTVLELGSGVGLTSIVTSMFARRVLCTDVNLGGILDLIRSNVAANCELVRSELSVMPLDFCNLNWCEEMTSRMREVEFVLAADVIYDNDLTEAFLQTLTKILRMPPKKTVFIAVEKRFVFTVADLKSVAPCYEHFIETISNTWADPPMSNWSMRLVPIDFLQCFNYDRVRHLVLWQISVT